jgi:hypothetical protein
MRSGAREDELRCVGFSVESQREDGDGGGSKTKTSTTFGEEIDRETVRCRKLVRV